MLLSMPAALCLFALCDRMSADVLRDLQLDYTVFSVLRNKLYSVFCIKK